MKYDINNPRPTPSQERLKELLSYDPISGVMTWVNHKNRTDLNGKPLGRKRKGGYLCASVDGETYSVHRLVYKYMTGNEPNIIDHIDGNPSNNKWDNLRSVTRQQNNLNIVLPKDNKSGAIGVFYHESQNRYHANVRINGRSFHIGSYSTKAEAVAARGAANKLLGFSERHGDAA